MQQPEPDRVVTLPMVNAFVTTASGHREVMIGYPLLAGLSRGQLRSVLAHEMGHLAHGHTRTGGLAYRASGVLEQTVARLDKSLVRRFVVGYHRLYLLISMSVLRDHERQADDWSARLVGGPEAASAFPAVARLGAVWDLLVDDLLPLAASVNARPPLVQAIHELSAGHQTKLDWFVDQRVNRKPSRWSTHPSDSERIQRLQSAPAVQPAPEPAWHVLGRQTSWTLDPQVGGNALLAIEADLLGEDMNPASWEQVVHESQVLEVRESVGFLVDQLSAQVPHRPANLRSTLEILSTGARGPAGALVTPLMRGDLPVEQRPAALEASIATAARASIYLTLVDQGRAWTSMRWDGPGELAYRRSSGEVVASPPELEITVPLDGEQAARILGWLAWDGIDIDAPFVTDAVSAGGATTGHSEQAPVRRLHSITNGGIAAMQLRPRRPGLGRRVLHDVLVMDDGLLISRVPGKIGMRVAFQARYLPGRLERQSIERLQQLVDAVAGDPQSWADTGEALWVPYPTVRHSALSKGLDSFWGKHLDLDLADGTTLKLKWTSFSIEVGEVHPTLRAVLLGPA
jgi:hypothetical protein